MRLTHDTVLSQLLDAVLGGDLTAGAVAVDRLQEFGGPRPTFGEGRTTPAGGESQARRMQPPGPFWNVIYRAEQFCRTRRLTRLLKALGRPDWHEAPRFERLSRQSWASDGAPAYLAERIVLDRKGWLVKKARTSLTGPVSNRVRLGALAYPTITFQQLKPSEAPVALRVLAALAWLLCCRLVLALEPDEFSPARLDLTGILLPDRPGCRLRAYRFRA